jgi:hypothetical protein
MGISQILDGLSTDMGIGVVFKQQLQGLSRNFTDSRIAPSAKMPAHKATASDGVNLVKPHDVVKS